VLIRVPWRSLLVGLAAVVLTAAAPAPLLYSRHTILQGEVWRLLTCHLVHGTFNHLLWDVLPLLGVGVLFERSLKDRFWSVLAVSSVVVCSGLLVLQPDLPTYCGLSGVLNGLWVAGCLSAARDERSAGSPAVAALYQACVLALMGKIAFEAVTGAPLFTDPSRLGGVAVPMAHALGALGGVLALPPRAASVFRSSCRVPLGVLFRVVIRTRTPGRQVDRLKAAGIQLVGFGLRHM